MSAKGVSGVVEKLRVSAMNRKFSCVSINTKISVINNQILIPALNKEASMAADAPPWRLNWRDAPSRGRGREIAPLRLRGP